MKKLRDPKTFEQPLCSEIDPNFFYIDDEDDETVPKGYENKSYTLAVKICSQCVHKKECAEWGIMKERWGVWGGLTPVDRVRIRQERKITLLDNL